MRKILLMILVLGLIYFVSAEPAYSIDVWLSKTKINPGENIALKIGFLGEGQLSDYNKIKIVVDGETFFIMENKPISGSLQFPINGYYFNNQGIDDQTKGLIVIPKELLPVVNISSKKEGDHTVVVAFLYSDNESDYYMDQKEYQFHVKTIYERNEKLIIFSGLIFSIVAFFFGGAYNEEIKNFIRKIFSKKIFT
ncbi:MAG: hypothetical protein AABW51_03125 [Nanoarchaeota archaeon]